MLPINVPDKTFSVKEDKCHDGIFLRLTVLVVTNYTMTFKLKQRIIGKYTHTSNIMAWMTCHAFNNWLKRLD